MKTDRIISDVIIEGIILCILNEEAFSGEDGDAELPIGDTKRTFLCCKSPFANQRLRKYGKCNNLIDPGGGRGRVSGLNFQVPQRL
jgi:hypothetical protein